MNDGPTALVTAVGGDIGWSVARILLHSGRFRRAIGCDVTADCAAVKLLDGCYVVPRAEDPRYLDAIAGLVRREAVDYLFPISEPEIERVFFAVQGGWRPATVVLAEGRAIPVGLDKLATARFLQEMNLPAPWTIAADAGDPPQLPCVLKDRRGWGSRSLVVIDDLVALQFYRTRRPRAILQQLLLPDDEEYTCGLFRSRSGETRTITFRRRLRGGVTGFGVVVRDDEIEGVLQTVATGLQLRGSINVQLRRTATGPTVFEVNPRFSGTVMFRDLLGFRDVLWSIDDLEDRDIPAFTPPVGTKVFRVPTEVVVPPA